MRILWLYRYASWYNFDHWFHMDFAKTIKKLNGVDLVGYGLDLENGHPKLAFPYDKDLTMEDLKKELDFDVVIINTMSRMFEKYTPPRLEGQELRYNCWLPKDFASFNKTPKLVIEEDYHYQDNDDWFYENGINLVLQRHYSQSLRGQKVKHEWFPFSVDTNTFYHDKTISKENKICFAGNSGGVAYPFRRGVCEILKDKAYFVNKKATCKEQSYLACLHNYICHLNGSSLFDISSAKMFEIMASGSLLFTNESDKYGLKMLFPEGSYCTYKEDFSDLLEKASMIIHNKYYVGSATNRARSCIESRHTHEIRAQQLVDLIRKKYKKLRYKYVESSIIEEVPEIVTPKVIVPEKNTPSLEESITPEKVVFKPKLKIIESKPEKSINFMMESVADNNVKRVMLTGGEGFLGSHVNIQLLHRGHKVFIPKIEEYDLRKLSDIKKAYADFKPNIVIHLAALAGGIEDNMKRPAEFFYDNAIMGIQLMEEARKLKLEKFVTLGTASCYPENCPAPFKEEDLWSGYPNITNAPYAMAKKMLLVQTQAYRKQYSFDAIFLLATNLYGPRDKSSHVIASLIKKFLTAKKNKIRKVSIWGSRPVTRDFLYVEDCAKAIILAMEKYNKSEPLNIGSGEEVTMGHLASTLNKLTEYGKNVVFNSSKPTGQINRVLDVSKAKTEINFEAEMSLENGLKKTIEWYKGEI